MNMESNERRSGSGKVIVVLALILLVAADVFLLYQLFDKNDELGKKQTAINALNVTKDSLVVEINTLQQKIDELKKQYADLGEADAGKEKMIEELTKKLNNAKRAVYSGDPKLIAQAKKDIADAKEKKKKFDVDLQNMQSERDAALSKNQALMDSLQKAQSEASKLGKEKGLLSKKIKEGSALKADLVVATSLKISKSGKESPTQKAKKVNKVKVCFKLQQNLITEGGLKTIYMRVLGPDRSVISTNTNETFTMDGDKLPFTEKKEIQYDNKDTDGCINFKKTTEFSKGDYTAELYEGGIMIGKTKFTLK